MQEHANSRGRGPRRGSPRFTSLSPSVRLSLAVLNRRLASLRPGVPENLIIGLTSRCQLACTHCHFNQGPGEGRHRDMPYSLAVRLLEQTAAAGIPRVTFFGGEPALYPRLTSLISAATHLGLFTELDTNGLRLLEPGFRAALCAAGLCAARVSLHSESAAGHDGLAGKGSSGRAKAAVKASVDSGLLTYVSACVLPAALSSGAHKKLLAFAGKAGAHGVRLLAYSAAGHRSSLPRRLAASLAGARTAIPARACLKAGSTRCAAVSGEILYVGPAGAFSDCPYSPAPFASLDRGGLRKVLRMRAARGRQKGFPCQKTPRVLVE